MARLLRLLLLVLVVAAVTSVVNGGETTCTETCEDDDESGECAPGCADCAHCVRPPSMAAAADSCGTFRAAHRCTMIESEDLPASADRGEMLLVPIRA